MFNSLKKTFLASLGAVAFSHDKLKQIIDELTARGELSREQGKKLFETLLSRGREESDEISSHFFNELQSWRELIPISRKELQKLAERVDRLEAGIHQGKMDDGAPSGPEAWTGGSENASVSAVPHPGAGALEESGEALPPRPVD